MATCEGRWGNKSAASSATQAVSAETRAQALTRSDESWITNAPSTYSLPVQEFPRAVSFFQQD